MDSALYILNFTLHTLHFTLHPLHFTLYTPHFTLYTPPFTLYTLHSTLHTLHFTLYTPHFTLDTPHSTLYTLHFTLYTPRFTLYTPHFTLHTLHFALHTPQFALSTLYTLHSTLYTLHFTLHTLQCTLYTLHFTLHTLHSTLYTVHSPLYTLHSTFYTLHSALHTLHSTLYTPHSTLYTPHFILYTFHSTLRTLHCIPPLNTPLSSHPTHTLHSTPFHIPQSKVHWRGNRGKNYQTFQIMGQVTRLKAPFFPESWALGRGLLEGLWPPAAFRCLSLVGPCWWLQRGPLRALYSVPRLRTSGVSARSGGVPLRLSSRAHMAPSRGFFILRSLLVLLAWRGELRWVGVGHPSCPPDLDTLASGGLVWGVGSAGP